MAPYEEHVREIMRVISEGASKDEILRVALKVKAEMSDEVTTMGRAIFALDSLIDMFAPDPNFPHGWQLLPSGPVGMATSPGQPQRRTRGQRVLEIARQIVADDGTVTGKAIAEQLRREGEQTAPRNLAVSAGNVLARSDDWEIVSPGVYRHVPHETEVVF